MLDRLLNREAALTPPNASSFAEIWATAQHRRSRYARLLLRRAARTGQTWLRRVFAGKPMRKFGEMASLHSP